MQKIIFLLIPLLFLASCMINGNDKENKITESTSKILINTTTQSGIIEKGASITSSGVEIKQIGSGFTLSQTDNETILSYNGKTIKTWSHIPPEKVPFIWDEACVDFFEAMDMVSLEDRDNNKNWKQSLWEKFDINTKKNCMKEFFSKKISIKQITQTFFEIRELHYERYISWLYDTKTGNIQSLPIEGQDIQISQTDSSITVFIVKNFDGDDIRMNYTSDFSQLISKEEIPKQ